eukprot:GEMP01052302.1.p1 GENE.GEMP01052302.1~~GEMP01052302.1.p1  ORF type:complete len:460 (+),score=100.78 GEMP01052302.1:77-1456(+)
MAFFRLQLLTTSVNAANPCLDSLRAWNYSPAHHFFNTVTLQYLPKLTSRYDLSQVNFFHDSNETAMQCAAGGIWPVPGRLIDIALGFDEPGKERKMQGLYTEVMNCVTCLPARECTDERQIREALIEVVPHLVQASAFFLSTWEQLDIDWVIAGLYKHGSTSMAKYMSLHPQLSLVWNTPVVLEHSIFTDMARVLPLEHRVASFNNAKAPNEDTRCREWKTGMTQYGRDCLAANRTISTPTSRGIKMLPSGTLKYSGENTIQSVAHRFLWSAVFPALPLRIIVSVTDPVQCFYSKYYYGSPEWRSTMTLEQCIMRAVTMLEENQWNRQVIEEMGFAEDARAKCALIHNSCAASFVLAEGCGASPNLCTPDRLKVVHLHHLDVASYNRLVRWASKGKATQEFSPDFIRYHQTGSKNTSKWVIHDGVRHPREIHYQAHQVLEMSFTLEYRYIKMWLDRYAP